MAHSLIKIYTLGASLIIFQDQKSKVLVITWIKNHHSFVLLADPSV